MNECQMSEGDLIPKFKKIICVFGWEFQESEREFRKSETVFPRPGTGGRNTTRYMTVSIVELIEISS